MGRQNTLRWAFIAVGVAMMGLARSAGSDEVRVTVYNDGYSCAGGCDAHVVFHPTMNGTRHAHRPNAPSVACAVGEPCRLCFDEAHASCVDTMYRGAGPSPGVFDVTPAFFAKLCTRHALPHPLASACAQRAHSAALLSKAVNCIREPNHARCRALMVNAQTQQNRDARRYEQCRREGQARFNADRPVEQKRWHDCAYEYAPTGGPNSRGLRWRRLQPGACPAGSYLGEYGLDCCTGVPSTDAMLGSGCARFYQ
ncbi:MAG: hypothetical protein AAGC71_12910 [Pseudomonadota bacterium]